MRLLVDVHCFDYSTTEGINTYLEGLYTELVKQAPEIDFYFMAANVAKVRKIFGEGSNINYIPLKSTNKYYRLLFEIPQIVKRYKIDYAHYQYTGPFIKNCKFIVTLHDILFLDYPQYFHLTYRLSKNILFKTTAKRTDILLTVSNYSKSRINHHYGIPLDKIHVTPDAVSDEFYSINAEESKSFVEKQGIDKYILYVSRLEPRKNQLAVLKSYCELRLWERGYDLVFIGRKTIEMPDFNNYLDGLDNDIQKRIHIFYQVPFNELKLWYKSASLFVYPALAEGFGIPPVEAGAAGVPCVCSNKTAMGDFSFFGEYQMDPTIADSINKAIEKILENEIDTKAIQEKIKNTYNWKNIAERYHHLLQKEINSK